MTEYEKKQITLHTTRELVYSTVDNVLYFIHPGSIIKVYLTDLDAISKLCLYVGRLHTRDLGTRRR